MTSKFKTFLEAAIHRDTNPFDRILVDKELEGKASDYITKDDLIEARMNPSTKRSVYLLLILAAITREI